MLAPIGKYNVEKVLGEGGFGVVYLAFDPDVGQPVAIKKLRAAGDPDLLKRFQMEIRTTASLRHKNIVTIHASGEDAGDPYLVMEFLEGSTLKQIIRERRPLSLLERVRIMTQVAEGLAYANAKGVVHRDVKPENIMLLPDDTVKIMDFGIALGPNRNTAVTQTGGIIGTPPYFAPEQLEGHKATEQTDIFSYGDVYYELLTGGHPFEQSKGDWRALQLAILTMEPRSVSELVPGCPESLELLVHRTLAKSPEFRYQKFEEVQLDNEAILVDLRHEGAAEILREVRPLIESGNFQTAQLRINKAYQLEPGNREVRRLREEINLRVQREQVQVRIDSLLADAATQMAGRRFAEAVQNLEVAQKLDTRNMVIGTRLEEAKARLESSNHANRLVSEARLKQQKGSFDEALRLFESALAIDPDHTDAKRLAARVSDELAKRRRSERWQQAIRAAQERMAAKQFAVALEILQKIEQEQPGAAGVAELRAEIRHREAEEERRLRSEQFDLSLARIREALQAGDLERAKPLMDYLFTNFAAEPGAADVLLPLRQQFHEQVRAREIAQYQHKARGLLRDKSFQPTLALLAEALAKFPEDAGLQRLNQSALDLYREHQRGEAIAAVLRDASAKRDAGDLRGALRSVLEGRQKLGEEAAFVGLLRELEMEIEQQRYSAGLESLLHEARQSMAAGRFAEAVDRIQKAKEFGAEAEVRALLEAARSAAAVETEKHFVGDVLSATENLESRAAWKQALEIVERGLARYPHNSSLSQAADRLRSQLEAERRRASIEQRCAAIRAAIEKADWTGASAALQNARSEFPGERAFDELASRVEAGEFDAVLQSLEARVRQNLAANAIDQAEENLVATRTMYAGDRRWNLLAQEVARRKEYETGLLEAARQRDAQQLSEAEQLLTEIIQQGAPDQRADHLRDAIRVQRSETLRQAEIARIADKIRHQLKHGDTVPAAVELAAARSRYPGENVWTELEAGVDAQQQAHHRQTDLAAAEQRIRQLLGRDELQEAVSVLGAARARYPSEAVWAVLEAEITARQEQLRRQQEISVIEASVHGGLDREIANILSQASDAPAGAYPIARVWDALCGVAERLDQARAKYPAEAAWEAFVAELVDRQARLKREITGAVRSSPDLLALDWTARQLEEARTRYPNEPFWKTLTPELEARRETLRLASIADSTTRIEQSLRQHELEMALQQLDAASQKHPGERRWEELQREIDARRAQGKRQGELAAAQKSAREELERVDQIPQQRDCPNPIEVQWQAFENAAVVLSEARAKYPDESTLETLQAEVEARRSRWQSDVSQRVTKAIRDDTNFGVIKAFGPQISSLIDKEPGEPLWARLKSEIDALEALLNRQAAVSSVGDRVRQCLSRNEIQQAEAHLDAARAGFPNEPLWETLNAEIASARALEERRRREARDRDRDRLSAISRQIETETRRRKRKDLAREAHSVAASYADDPEMASLAAAIDASVEPPQVEPPRDEPRVPTVLPWKWIAGGAVAAVAAAALVFGVLRKPPAPAVPTSIATVPIEIRTDPPGAAVRIADRTCVTPNCRLDLKPGTYPIEARLQGYETRQQTVTVDSTNQLLDWTLEPVRVPPPVGTSVGTLVVRTGVPDALIYIDDVPQPTRTDQSGTVSLSVEAKAHQVRVERNQYERLPAKLVRISAGSHQEVVFRMALEKARLELSGGPANLELRVDGKPSTFPSALQAGEHTLTVSQGTLQPAQGPASSSLTQRFEPGQTVQLTWKANPAPPANPPATPTAAPKKQPGAEELEAQAWEQVRSGSNPAQLREFRSKYPASSHASEIQAMLDRLAWTNVKTDSSDSLRAYLQEFPSGAHTAEANSLLAELAWKGIDPSKIDQVRKFVEENPSNPHVRDAQRILEQFNARQQVRKQVLDTLTSFDQALESGKASELKALWPSASEAFLKPAAHTTYGLKAAGDPNISADQMQARIPCVLTISITQPKRNDQKTVTVELQNRNGQWRIEKIN